MKVRDAVRRVRDRSARQDRNDGPLRIIESVPPPRPTTNPYNKMLSAALDATEGLDHRNFSWREALIGRYDVFHWHWPEAALGGTTWWKTAGKHLAMAALVLKHRLAGVAVVRTVHNLELPETNPVARRLLKLIDRGTALRIVLNEETRLPDDQPAVLIWHGHYRDWFAEYPRNEPVTGQLGYFGNVRRYKSLDALLDAYEQAARADDTISLRIGGRPSTPELGESLARRVAGLPRAEARLEFLTDSELVALTTSSEVVVLPYRHMHNSGSVLAALSLDRPVLVPRNPTNESLCEEVGPGWVRQFDGDLTAEDLRQALQHPTPPSRPDLTRRDWDLAGQQHAAAYRRAAELRTGRRDRRTGQERA